MKTYMKQALLLLVILNSVTVQAKERHSFSVLEEDTGYNLQGAGESVQQAIKSGKLYNKMKCDHLNGQVLSGAISSLSGTVWVSVCRH